MTELFIKGVPFPEDMTEYKNNLSKDVPGSSGKPNNKTPTPTPAPASKPTLTPTPKPTSGRETKPSQSDPKIKVDPNAINEIKTYREIISDGILNNDSYPECSSS